jgi:hypothetical protein
MTKERAKWMDQASFWTSGTAEASGKLCRSSMASSEPGRMLASASFQGGHLGNVGQERLGSASRAKSVAVPVDFSIERYRLP